MTDKSQKFAFSLVELLIVISIIPVILSISLPALQKTRQRAKFVICKSNLKQNYISLSAYGYNNNGSWPQTDYSLHTHKFFCINSQNTHGPIYYLWLNGYLTNPKTWYCPSGPDKFKNNWQTINKGLEPNSGGAVSGYQYRMFFAFNWPKRSNSRSSQKSYGILKPDLHRNLAVWTDAFGEGPAVDPINHKSTNNWNVLFNDSSVRTRTDKKKIISGLDLSWYQAGDWRVALSNGNEDIFHNAALLWHFFDTSSWGIRN